MREAPSLDLLPMLTAAGHSVRAHDPIAMENAKAIVGDGIEWIEKMMDSARDADAVVVLTEWDEFRGADFKKLKEVMKGNLLFDGRNIYDPAEVEEVGLTYYGIGL